MCHVCLHAGPVKNSAVSIGVWLSYHYRRHDVCIFTEEGLLHYHSAKIGHVSMWYINWMSSHPPSNMQAFQSNSVYSKDRSKAEIH